MKYILNNILLDRRSSLFLLVFFVLLYGCKRKNGETLSEILPNRFTEIPSSQTNITFNNLITENDSVNLIANEYSYIGAGVGIGDFNNDGLSDVFFAGNQVSSRLYINKGDFKFEDLTDKAGLKSNYWATGVSIIDINSDGLDDIYVCVSGSKSSKLRKNKLYINNGNLTFREQAEAYGLAEDGFSTQAVFFDYDKDGDLDMYLLNHLLFTENRTTIVKRDTSGKSPAADKLFKNIGINKDNHPVYEDVSIASGVREDGYGLGVVVSDFNNDNWPDIYVANDYTANDILWLNNKNGTFTNCIPSAIKHQSYSSMGVDAADVNNDGLSDLVTLDMLPQTTEGKKMMHSFLSNERYELERRTGYQPQFGRNMLQLNNGIRQHNGKDEPYFSEIGQLAGIHETDWSWSVLLADFDNDGWKDMHITNGYGRDMLNIDFIMYKSNALRSSSGNDKQTNDHLVKKLSELGGVSLNNFLFRNNGDHTFSDVSEKWGIKAPSISHGCAYVDLDNDGDLDLVANNINSEAFVLKNNTRENDRDQLNSFLKIKLSGDSSNLKGFGTLIRVFAAGKEFTAEQSPVRGYASSVDQLIHIGLGKIDIIDSLFVVWPDDKKQKITHPKINSQLTVRKKEATLKYTAQLANKRFFEKETDKRNTNYKHNDPFFFDYQFQRFLPQKYSQLGPFISTGDINGDGMEDFFIGGAYSEWGSCFIQQKNGSFLKKTLSTGEKNEEDLGSVLIDIDGDKDLDLILASGGFEYEGGSPFYKPRIYINDGKGNFSWNKNAIPGSVNTSAQVVSVNDLDNDGDMDLLIAGRVTPGQFPLAPRSYILLNDGRGNFMDATEKICPELSFAGMITSCVWTDLDGDKQLDLVIAGEWMPIRFFKNQSGKLIEITATTGLTSMNGQWRSLYSTDVDHDGDMDLVAGNLGLNNKFKVSPDKPMKFFVKDLDNNGLLDPILAYYIVNKSGKRELYPAIDRTYFASQVPSIKNRFLYHADYSVKKIGEIFTPEEMQGMVELVCEETRSVWIENLGNGKFLTHPLPIEAQFAPINSIVGDDLDGDGNVDLIVGGNEYQAEVSTGRYDASYGLVLKGDGKGNFTAIPPSASGFIIDGDVKDMKLLKTGRNETLLLIGINDSDMETFRIKN